MSTHEAPVFTSKAAVIGGVAYLIFVVILFTPFVV